MNEINYKLLQQVHKLRPATRSQIIGVGGYLPKQRVTSKEIMSDIQTERQYGLAHEWMDEKMGIKERRMVSDHEKPSSLAIAAAKDAFNSHPEIDPNMIDAVIFCGIERDLPEPATAHVIQDALGLNAAYTFDMANACFGFFQGLKVADSLIDTGSIDYALIVTGEITTKMARIVADQLKAGIPANEAKHLWGMLSVGDAGGAMILGPSKDNNSGFEKFHQLSESRHRGLCHYDWTPDGGVKAHMNMSQIVARGLKMNKQVHKEILGELGWSGVDWVIAHQTGKAAFQQTQELHGVEKSKIIKTYPKLGNITTATLPISFKKLIASDNLKSGDKVAGLFAGSGLVAGQFGYVV